MSITYFGTFPPPLSNTRVHIQSQSANGGGKQVSQRQKGPLSWIKYFQLARRLKLIKNIQEPAATSLNQNPQQLFTQQTFLPLETIVT